MSQPGGGHRIAERRQGASQVIKQGDHRVGAGRIALAQINRVGQAHGSLEMRGESLGRARQRTDRLTRQVGNMLGDLVGLEGDGARIGVVGQQQIDHRCGLDRGQVARAVGDGAVGDAQ